MPDMSIFGDNAKVCEKVKELPGEPATNLLKFADYTVWAGSDQEVIALSSDDLSHEFPTAKGN